MDIIAQRSGQNGIEFSVEIEAGKWRCCQSEGAEPLEQPSWPERGWRWRKRNRR